MQVDHAIILSAGKGTRMGEIGRVLAKPLWPFYGKTLIQHQIDFLNKRFGIKKFFINAHHLHEQLNPFRSDNVEVIYEPVLLDQGGGILNILKKYKLWDTPVLVNNADQLYFFDEKYFKQATELLYNNDAVLFGLNVKKSQGYNQLEVKQNQLLSIIKNAESNEDTFNTFSGMSLLKSKEVNYNNEVLPYFKSVADYKNKSVAVMQVKDSEYYDFGKLKDYFELCAGIREKVLEKKSDELLCFLDQSFTKYITSEKGINFSSREQELKPNEIALDQGILRKEGEKIITIMK